MVNDFDRKSVHIQEFEKGFGKLLSDITYAKDMVYSHSQSNATGSKNNGEDDVNAKIFYALITMENRVLKLCVNFRNNLYGGKK